MTEDETTSSSRIFIKILLNEMQSLLGLKTLAERFREPSMQEYYRHIFPMDHPSDTRFSINFFTSIGLGVVTETMRERLKIATQLMMERREAEWARRAESEGMSSDSDGSYSRSSRSRSYSSSYSGSYTPSSRGRSYSRSLSPRGRSYSRSPSPRGHSYSQSPRPRRYSYSRSPSPRGAHTRVPQALEVVPTLALPPIRAPRARIVQTCVVSAIHIAMITAILRLPARKVHEGRRQWRRPGIVIRLRHQSVDVLHLAHRLHGLCVHRSHHMLT